jgi:hypothetical protein
VEQALEATPSRAPDAQPGIEARVTRYNVLQLRIGQCLIPVAAIANVLIRRAPDVLPPIVGFAVLLAVLFVLLSAAKRLGWQALTVQHRGVVVGKTGVRVASTDVARWTYHVGTARLYGTDTSFKLRARPGRELDLEAALRRTFGSPLDLERRGSRRARATALSVAVLGLALDVFAIMYDVVPMALIGTLCLLFGVGTFAALSSRAVRR